jgi:RNA polymerase sigma-70 factor (ECF subfamily)
MQGSAWSCISVADVGRDADEHLAAIAAGDPEAFASWVALCEPPIRMSLLRFAAQLDVESVTQECLLRIWQVAPRVQPDGRPNALLRYGVRIARNLAISELRRRRARPEGHVRLEGDGPGTPDTGASEVESVAPIEPDPRLREIIAQCREQLPKRPAEVLALRLQAQGGRDDHALSASLGMKTNTFLKNFGRARALLRKCLESHGINLELELP